MRLYGESSEETLRARSLVKQWRDDGLLGEEQSGRLEQDTVSDLRTTNIFLRIVLFLFTAIAVGAAVALFFTMFTTHPTGSTTGAWFLVFAVLSYIAAEVAAAQARLYRYGIEEALAVCSVAFVCIGLGAIFPTGSFINDHKVQMLLSTAGAGFSLWLFHRFGFWYAFPAAMVFTGLFIASWTVPQPVQRCLLCVLYAGGLAGAGALRSRHRFDSLEAEYSLAEAFLWSGIYLVLNLKLSSIPAGLWGVAHFSPELKGPFYWTTWVLIWCLPPAILSRGIRGKDRFVIAAGLITAVLTLVTNKPYLGWQRHTWDPMLLGIALLAVAAFLFRWLARGPAGVRHGFTAARLHGKHKNALGVAQSIFGLLSPHSVTPEPQPEAPKFEGAQGGSSGGAGASGEW